MFHAYPTETRQRLGSREPGPAGRRRQATQFCAGDFIAIPVKSDRGGALTYFVALPFLSGGGGIAASDEGPVTKPTSPVSY